MAEARALADEAEAAGVVHAVSLQGYHSPSARFVADLIAGGRLGQVESIAMITAVTPWAAVEFRSHWPTAAIERRPTMS